MSELDLVPIGYRRGLWLRRVALRFGVLYLALVVCLIGARVAISQGIDATQNELERLHDARVLADERQARLAELAEERETLSRRLAVLRGLRGGVAAKQMFSVMDRALEGDVWFTSWTFRRAGEIVDKTPEAVETGYFIVVPKSSPKEQDKAWRMETHMEISAAARDHTALARFVRNLAEQSEVESVRILNTRARREATGDVIDFRLALLVRSRT